MVNVLVARKILSLFDLKVICFDIGSAGGFHPLMKQLESQARLYGFDADPEEAQRLNSQVSKSQTILNAAVGPREEFKDFHLMKKRQSSSFYLYNQYRMSFFDQVENSKERSEVEKVIKLKTKSLDQICSENKIESIDFIKIDAEGFEKEILRGTSSFPLAVELEINFHPLRKEAPLFHEIMELLTERKYIIIDLRRIFWNSNDTKKLKNYSNKGFLILGDALFILDPFSTDNKEIFSLNYNWVKLISLLSLYGYAAEALSVLTSFFQMGIIENSVYEKIEKTIVEGFQSPKKLPLLIGKVMRKVNSQLESFVETPYSIRGGFGKNTNYQGDLMLGADKLF